MDSWMGRDAALHNDNEVLRVAIIADNFLPQIDGSTVILALLRHLATSAQRAVVRDFISPAFLRALRFFSPHVIHLAGPICPPMQALIAPQILFPSTPIVTSHHMNLPTDAEIFGYAYFHHRTRQIHAYLHSFARYTLVPSPSTARLLREKGGET
ncbi:hypothetical protein B0H13DRAFT_2318328 [Mycena leptocephala]|nr:hypothetical protein B0H13DRAFT_2318328 [Mycena leptocephala]